MIFCTFMKNCTTSVTSCTIQKANTKSAFTSTQKSLGRLSFVVVCVQSRFDRPPLQAFQHLLLNIYGNHFSRVSY